VKKKPRILLCPLDWGIGHATRIVPVIRKLQENDVEVVIGADGRAYDFLEQYFPVLEFIRLPGPRVSYPSSGRMAWKMLVQAPKILAGIRKEHRLLQQIIREHRIDAVISDNRFGIWSKEVSSVYITHQVRIKAPKGWGFTEPILSLIHWQFWKNCRECWIPDYPGEPNLSGQLGHPGKLSPKCHYIGPLSRFSSINTKNEDVMEDDGPDLLVLLSGPEPQRSIFEDIVLRELQHYPDKKTVILRGLPGKQESTSPHANVTMYSHLPDARLVQLIHSAKTIICRPGYSTLMDLACLGKGAVLVPTPGQTEQEYLAKYHAKGGAFARIEQKEFTLNRALALSNHLNSSNEIEANYYLLEERIRRLVRHINNR
jgi:uncharacterized protein (TIGR00661 family)